MTTNDKTPTALEQTRAALTDAEKRHATAIDALAGLEQELTAARARVVAHGARLEQAKGQLPTGGTKAAVAYAREASDHNVARASVEACEAAIEAAREEVETAHTAEVEARREARKAEGHDVIDRHLVPLAREMKALKIRERALEEAMAPLRERAISLGLYDFAVARRLDEAIADIVDPCAIVRATPDEERAEAHRQDVARQRQREELEQQRREANWRSLPAGARAKLEAEEIEGRARLAAMGLKHSADGRRLLSLDAEE